MRSLVLSLSAFVLVFGAAWAQTGSGSSSIPQIAYGQSYKNFEFPVYENGQLSRKLTATQATGMSLNRAEVTNMKIEIYTNGKVTMTITSPKADLYTAERRMRTANTVRVDRADMTATSQRCDYDLASKQYVMRDKVRVILKNFDTTSGAGSTPKPAPGAAAATRSPAPSPANDSLLDSPGTTANGTDDNPSSPAAPGHP